VTCQPQPQLLLAALLSLCGAVSLAEPASIDLQAVDLRDNDRVVFVGGTFIERMQQYGYLETILTVALADKHITFRNLGWSGDTVRGESRALFGSQADGFARLVKDVKETKPTLLVICYGANEAHAGKAGLPQFVDGLNRLLDELAETKARVVLLSPYAYRAGPPGFPSPDAYNASLHLYCDAIRKTAVKRNAQYVSLYDLLDTIDRQEDESPVTENGLHLTKVGYRRAAFEIVRRMGIDLPKIDLAANGARLEKLRATIQLKNELYFHRYRPQNETYLFLFRKHEQGNNAVEIPQFDPLVEEQEKIIAKLKILNASS
jgi:lysophospholipase L1-like esterase